MPITIVRFGADDIRAHLGEFVDLLGDVVEHGASVNFLSPIDPDEAAAFWDKVAGMVEAGERILIAALDADGRVVGTTQLVLAMQANGSHRAEVQEGVRPQQGATSASRDAVDDRHRGRCSWR